MRTTLLLLTAILGLSGEARADDGSWCVAGFEKGPAYGKGGAGSTAKDACAAFLGKKKAWHFHGFVAKDDRCYACWDEESSTCETKVVATRGYRYLGGRDCGSVAIAKVGDTRHVDPTPPPPPPPPPARPSK